MDLILKNFLKSTKADELISTLKIKNRALPFNEIQEVDEPMSMMCSFNSSNPDCKEAQKTEEDKLVQSKEEKTKSGIKSGPKIPFPKVKSSSVDRDYPVYQDGVRKEGFMAKEFGNKQERTFKQESFSHVTNKSSDACPNLIKSGNLKTTFPKSSKNDLAKLSRNCFAECRSGDVYLLSKSKAASRNLPYNNSIKQLQNHHQNRHSHSNRDCDLAQDTQDLTETESKKVETQRQETVTDEALQHLSAEPELSKRSKMKPGTFGPKGNFMSMLFHGKNGRIQAKGKQGPYAEESGSNLANKSSFKTPIVRGSLKFYKHAIASSEVSIDFLKKKHELNHRKKI